ncbi:MAG: tRNA lysidine(34) synthetase TilS [Puniceicoccales bacterium]|jgi:tRNA(Ile)-lysidine synthase|nr:tRNA lysidine(34) synthetase TilS [Puniceicoccales bacterium]
MVLEHSSRDHEKAGVRLAKLSLPVAMNTPPAESFDWRSGARSLARILPLPALEPAARALLADATSVAVACSGGVDSLVALLLAWAHFPGLRSRLVVLHFNHRTRAECEAEAAFVRTIAETLGIAFRGGVVSRDFCGKRGVGEAALREARLDFFANACRAVGTRVLVQGHHADDVVESVLMRLARGSGAAGLSAPRPVSRFSGGLVFVRPLILLGKAELSGAMRAAALPWCEDASNATGAYLRNRVRKSVVPAWAVAQGAVVARGVARSRRLLEEDDAALEAWLDGIWGRVVAGAPVYDWTPLAGLPAAVQRRALWRVLRHCPGAVTPFAVDAIVAALLTREPGRWSVGASAFLCFDGGTLRVEPSVALRRDAFGGEGVLFEAVPLFWPSGGVLSVAAVRMTEPLLWEICAGAFSPGVEVFLATPPGALFARFWREGDSYRPFGLNGTRKLSDAFADKKIPAVERRRLPVVCDAEGIAWVPGLPPAHRLRIGTLARTALRLTWTPPPPIFKKQLSQ